MSEYLSEQEQDPTVQIENLDTRVSAAAEYLETPLPAEQLPQKHKIYLADFQLSDLNYFDFKVESVTGGKFVRGPAGSREFFVNAPDGSSVPASTLLSAEAKSGYQQAMHDLETSSIRKSVWPQAENGEVVRVTTFELDANGRVTSKIGTIKERGIVDERLKPEHPEFLDNKAQEKINHEPENIYTAADSTEFRSQGNAKLTELHAVETLAEFHNQNAHSKMSNGISLALDPSQDQPLNQYQYIERQPVADSLAPIETADSLSQAQRLSRELEILAEYKINNPNMGASRTALAA